MCSHHTNHPPRSFPLTLVFLSLSTQALKRVRDHLVTTDKELKTQVVDDLDLTNVLSKAKAGSLATPNNVLMAIRTAWQAVHARNVASSRPSADPVSSKQAVNSESRLADALLHVHQCWLEEHLGGTVVDEDDFTQHVVAVNYKCVKTALASMAQWSQRHTWQDFVDHVKGMKEEASKKTDGPFRTYAQLESALVEMVAFAASAVRADTETDDPELYVADLRKWITEKWAENGLPELLNLPVTGKVASKLEGRRDNKRARYEEPASDDDFEVVDDKETKKLKTEDVLGADVDSRINQRTAYEKLHDEVSPGVQIGGPLPQGAAVCTTAANAVVAKIKCHKLQATAVVIRPAVVPSDASSFVALPPAVAPSPPPTPIVSAHGDVAPTTDEFGGDQTNEFQEPPPALGSRYVGPATELKILTVAGVAVNEDTDNSLSLPDNFEQHAFDIARGVENAGGESTKRIEPPGSSSEESSPDYFRANAWVYQREGVWIRFYEFEAKVVAANSTYLAVSSDTPSTKVVDGASIPGIRSGAVGGHVVGSSQSARDARGDMNKKFAEIKQQAMSAQGLERAAVLRSTIKQLDLKLAETKQTQTRLADGCVPFGELGRAARRMKGIDVKGDTYAGYVETVDRGIALASRAVLHGLGEGACI